MHTILVIAGGLALLCLFLIVGHRLGGATTAALATAAKFFIPTWLVAAAFNMWAGVARAGYTVKDEAPIFLVIFAVPALLALLVWWKYSAP